MSSYTFLLQYFALRGRGVFKGIYGGRDPNSFDNSCLFLEQNYCSVVVLVMSLLK